MKVYKITKDRYDLSYRSGGGYFRAKHEVSITERKGHASQALGAAKRENTGRSSYPSGSVWVTKVEVAEVTEFEPYASEGEAPCTAAST